MNPKNSITIHGRRFGLYIPEADIHYAISQVAEQINYDARKGDFNRPLVLVTLNGALIFGGELFRQLEGDFEIAFIKLSSYGSGMSSTEVGVDVPLTVNVQGRDVIIAEDVVDTGKTIQKLDTLLKAAGARQIRVATLLLKPEVYTAEREIDYVALESENRFIIGYGLDYNEAGRNLPDIYALEETE